ncbi:hypothetical protein BC829DRAFT_447981 [Chytridium lagenaria]|nr:hypothetical protein BC829DRAFT_447981 [Chytridium lagenaria]
MSSDKSFKSIGIVTLTNSADWPAFINGVKNWVARQTTAFKGVFTTAYYDTTHEDYEKRMRNSAKVVQAILSNVSGDILKTINEAPPEVSKTARRLLVFLKKTYGVNNTTAVGELREKLRDIKFEAKDTPVSFISRARSLWDTLSKANQAEQATEGLLCEHLVKALRTAGKVNPIWTPSRCDDLAKETTIKGMQKSMETLVSIHNRTNSDAKVQVLTATTNGNNQTKPNDRQPKNGKSKGKDRLHQLQPDAKLIAKAGPNSIHSTGYTFGQLKKMSKSRRMEVCKDLTCVACNTQGHISIDCPKVSGTKNVSHTQTGYKGAMQVLLTTVKELKEQISELKSTSTTRKTQVNHIQVKERDTPTIEIIERKDDGKRALDTSSIPAKRPRFAFFAAVNTDVLQVANVRIHPDLDDGVSQWAFDTGLTDQALTPFLEDLQDPIPYRAGVDGAFAGEQSEMIGIVKGFTNLGHAIQFPALYVPNIRVRLVSRNTLRDVGLYIQDSPGGSFLTRPGDGEVAEIIDSPSGLMILSLSPQGPRAPENIGTMSTIVDANDFSSFHADGQFDLANRTIMEKELEKLHAP